MRFPLGVFQRLKLIWFRQFKRRKLLNSLLKSSHAKDGKLSVFFTVDLEYNNFYPKTFEKYSYEGFGKIFDFVQKNKIPTTFFVEGRFAEDNREDIIDISNKDHEVGSHGYEHINLGPHIWWGKHFVRSNDFNSRKKSILKNHRILFNILKEYPQSFRSPYLSMDGVTLNILDKAGYKIDSSLNNFFFGLPSIPYHPSRDDILKVGNLDILEFFITTFVSKDIFELDYQHIKFQNSNDFLKNIKIVEDCVRFSPYVVILTHSWEFNEAFYPNIDERIRLLSKFIFTMKKNYNAKFLKMKDVMNI